ncbi:MAG TPA: hypothetical protein VM010_03880 [Chitinophagaceae bacterium]|nr:hypothetical protein [Chitinophagaceae bacterium]
MLHQTHHPASYRDPSGFVFEHEGVLYRQVNQSYKQDFTRFMESGLYSQLLTDKKLIAHEEIPINFLKDARWFTTLRPEIIPVITYPFEWCFQQLKEAALLTLALAEKAASFGMMLKDATPYNIQFYKGAVIFLDTLSFEIWDETKPWIAYRQFCETFLAPLALMNFLKTPLQPFLLAYPEGIPLMVAKKMLPLKSKFNLGCYLHLHLHAGYSAKKAVPEKTIAFSKNKLLHILQHLKQTITAFTLDEKSTWSEYYNEAAQRGDYLNLKKEIISGWILSFSTIKTAFDAGANEGVFTGLLAQNGIRTIAADGDHFAIDTLYNKLKGTQAELIIPIITNLGNPGPAFGANGTERASFFSRLYSDLVLALALMHHLVLDHQFSFEMLASFFAKLGNYLLIEFVPKEDEKARLLLSRKKDTYDWYTQVQFENVFSEVFQIVKRQEIGASGRTLYLMQQHGA